MGQRRDARCLRSLVLIDKRGLVLSPRLSARRTRCTLISMFTFVPSQGLLLPLSFAAAHIQETQNVYGLYIDLLMVFDCKVQCEMRR